MLGVRSVIVAAALAFAPASAFAQAAPATTAAAPSAKAADGTNRAAGPGTPESADAVKVRYPPSSARWKILVSGIAVTGVAYGGMALMGALWEGIPAADMHYIPVAGPWIAIANSGCGPTEETTPGEGDCEALIGLRAAIYVIDGLLQLGGLGLVVQSIAMTTEASSEAPAAKKATILPIPMITPTSVGFGVTGTF